MSDPYRPLHVAPPSESQAVIEEAWCILRERQVIYRAALGRWPSWLWRPVAYEAWCAERDRIQALAPSQYDIIEARNRLREGRSVQKAKEQR